MWRPIRPGSSRSSGTWSRTPRNSSLRAGRSPSARATCPLWSPAADRAWRSRWLTILLVEDNKDTLRYIALTLNARGHEVTVAERLVEALQIAEEQPMDLLISDIELPDGTGLELMRQLNGRGVPAIAMSG